MKRQLIHEEHFLSGWTQGDFIFAMVFNYAGNTIAKQSSAVDNWDNPAQEMDELLLQVAIEAGLDTSDLEVGA